MATKQGSLDLLSDPVAKELLGSTIPARLAYNWFDGTPRVVPIWFHWDGQEFALGSPERAPKLKAIERSPKVALTIDSTSPDRVLLVRGTAKVTMTDGVTPEYVASARRYLGAEQGKAWVEQLKTMVPRMGRIGIVPEWVGILDFETRFPSAMSS